jgi:hypothetical protein
LQLLMLVCNQLNQLLLHRSHPTACWHAEDIVKFISVPLLSLLPNPQTVHKLSGVGLLPWEGKVRRDFEARYRQWLTQQGTRFSSLTYVGSVVSHKP